MKIKKTKSLLLIIIIAVISCKKSDTLPLDAEKKPITNKKSLKEDDGSASGLNFLTDNGDGTWSTTWGGVNLHFDAITYETNAPQGKIAFYIAVSGSYGSIVDVEGSAISVTPPYAVSYYTAADLRRSLENYRKEFMASFDPNSPRYGQPNPAFTDYLRTHNVNLAAFEGFVIVDYNSPSGFSIISSRYKGTVVP
jgi:hypothetical protein